MAGSKKVLIIIGIIAAVLIIGLVAAYFLLTSSKTVTAQIHVEAGQVLVNGNGITEDSLLKEGDSIETGADGQATVILYESVLISLDENTKITLDELTQQHPKVSQQSGETWNKFTKLSGVEDYSISSGNSVASVRGTAFGFSNKRVITDEGEVNYEVDGKSYSVVMNQVAEILNGSVNERSATQEEKDKMNKKRERVIKMLRVLREKEMNKHPRVKLMIMKQLAVDEQGLRDYLERADNGEFDVDEVAKQSPIKLETIDRVAMITKKIREIRQMQQPIQGVNQTLNNLNER